MTMTWRGRILTAAELADVRHDPGRADALAAGADGKQVLELKKLWHGVKWVIANSPIPSGAEDGILGGTEVLRNEHGTRRLLEPDVVAAIASALVSATADDFADGFDPATMLDQSVYPAIWNERDVLDDKLVPAFTRYRRFFERAAAEHAGVITLIA